MGKPDVHIRLAGDGVAVAGRRTGVGAVVRRAVSLRCLAVLSLTACLLLTAVFWLLPIVRSCRFVLAPDRRGPAAEIQASFTLERSLISTNVKRLEDEILEEIGVPNSKVAIISLDTLTPENSTHVIFGVLPDPHNALISSAALSILKSSLIDLVLQQVNLSLTPSIFGYPSSFELLKFPGGIIVIPPQSAFILERTQVLFSFTLNNSVMKILKNLDQLKDELKSGLNLTSYENVYVDMANTNGSTVAPSVTIHASVTSDAGNGNLQPDRLKQLAQVLNVSHDQNLGLNHRVFGQVKEVELSSYLEHSISFIAPSPSPSPSPSPLTLSPSPSPSPSMSPSPS